jgi:membrane-associated phospholipid phosphatase
MNYLSQFEVSTVTYFNQLLNQHEAWTKPAYFAAVYLIWVMVALLLYYFLVDRRRKFGFVWLIIILGGAGLAWFLTGFVKYLNDFPRPFIAIKEFIPLFTTDGGHDSFPSGHATFAMAMAAGIFSLNRAWGALFIGLALVVGVARVFAGVHWPLDVLVGSFVGWLVVRIAMHIALYLKKMS